MENSIVQVYQSMEIRYEYGIIYIDDKEVSNAELVDILIKQEQEIKYLYRLANDLDLGLAKRSYRGIIRPTL